MLSFPLILTVIFTLAGVLLGVILLVVLLPRRDADGEGGPAKSGEWGGRLNGRNGDGVRR